MSYATIEAGIKTLLLALAQYDAGEVTQGDFRVLELGKPQCCVLVPGPFTSRVAGDWGQKAYDWTVYAKLYQRYLGNGSEWTNLETQRQNVVDQLHAYPSLNGVAGVTDVIVLRGDDVVGVYPIDADVPRFLLQNLVVRVHEEVLYTSGEFT